MVCHDLIYLDQHLPNICDRENYLCSPLLVPDSLIRRLPPSYIDVCSADPLFTGGVEYAKKLEENGVPVRSYVLEGMPHGSYILFPLLPSSVIAHDHFLKGLEWALSYKEVGSSA